MSDNAFQRAAQSAFTAEDWRLLIQQTSLVQMLTLLNSIEAVEAFIFDAHDELRRVREIGTATSLVRGAPCASIGVAAPAPDQSQARKESDSATASVSHAAER